MVKRLSSRACRKNITRIRLVGRGKKKIQKCRRRGGQAGARSSVRTTCGDCSTLAPRRRYHPKASTSKKRSVSIRLAMDRNPLARFGRLLIRAMSCAVTRVIAEGRRRGRELASQPPPSPPHPHRLPINTPFSLFTATLAVLGQIPLCFLVAANRALSLPAGCMVVATSAR